MTRTRLFMAMLVLTTAVACASPERSAQENNNGSSQPPQPAQSLTAQNGTAPATDPTAPSIEAAKPQAETQPAVKSDAPEKAAIELQAAGAPAAKAPKLVVPTSAINFGKQPQDKKFIRAISIRNSGSAD